MESVLTTEQLTKKTTLTEILHHSQEDWKNRVSSGKI
jgi:hypothetical protein